MPKVVNVDIDCLRQMYLVDKKSTAAIAAEIGTSQVFVWKKLNQMGINCSKSVVKNCIRYGIEMETVRKMYLENKFSATRIAGKLNVSTTAVYKVLNMMRITRSGYEAACVRHGIVIDELLLKRMYLEDSMSAKFIAGKFGVSEHAIWVRLGDLGIIRSLHSGYGNISYASDGHLCQSNFELMLEEWLIKNGIEHIPHPRIDTSRRRADQLVDEIYIEVDGMARDKEYWEEKYFNSEKYIVLDMFKRDFSFDNELASLLRTILG